MDRRALLSVALLGTFTSAVAMPADLAEAIAEYDRATLDNDVAALANLVADDYVLVNSDSTLQDKQSYLQDFKVPGFKLDPYELQQQILKRWDDIALLAGAVQLSWTLDGKRERRQLRIAHVWTRIDRRWRLAYTQLTRIPER